MNKKPSSEWKRLTQEQFYRLCRWVAVNAEKLLHERPSFRDAAALAEKELGFGVTARSLTTAAKLENVVWQSSSREKGVLKKKRLLQQAEDLRKVESRLTALEETVKILAGMEKPIRNLMDERKRQSDADFATIRALCHKLYQDLNATPPNGYVVPPKEQAIFAGGRDMSRVSTSHQ